MGISLEERAARMKENAQMNKPEVNKDKLRVSAEFGDVAKGEYAPNEDLEKIKEEPGREAIYQALTDLRSGDPDRFSKLETAFNVRGASFSDFAFVDEEQIPQVLQAIEEYAQERDENNLKQRRQRLIDLSR